MSMSDGEPETTLEDEKIYSIGRLMGGILHEVNNPLNAILMNAELAQMLLNQDGDAAQIRGTLQTIAKEVRRAGELTRQISNYMRAENFSPDGESSLAEATELAIKMLGSSVRKADVTLKTEIASDLPPKPVNKIALTQAIANLLFVAIRQQAKTIRLSVRVENGCQQVLVDHDGRPVRIDGELAHGWQLVRAVAAGHGGKLEIPSAGGTSPRMVLEFPADGSSDL